MKSIGIVGIENSHADHFVRFLNLEDRHPGYRLTALAGGDQERQKQLQKVARGQIEYIVENPDDLVGRVDAAIISSRDGGEHLAQATPLIEAGIPLLVDKPLAAGVIEAEQLLELAACHGTPVVSLSALRGAPELSLLKGGQAEVGTLLGLHLIGSASPSSPYSGLWFYGIHHVEAAIEVCGSTVSGPVVVTTAASSITATMKLGSVAVTLTFVDEEAVGFTPWSATAIGTSGTVHTALTLSDDYAAPVLDAFVTMLETGQQPYTTEELLAPVRLLGRIEELVKA